jgi:mannose-6-phosphate isomerase-like protein (cupin superfamily)
MGHMTEGTKMEKGTVVKATAVMPFTPKGYEGQFESKMLIDRTNSASEKLQINQFVLKPGCRTEGVIHQEPYDEVYYVLSGEAVLHLADEAYDIGKDTIIFIPGGTFHSLDNKSQTEDFVLLTIWHTHPERGVNEVYDMRKEAWGKTFRKIGE